MFDKRFVFLNSKHYYFISGQELDNLTMEQIERIKENIEIKIKERFDIDFLPFVIALNSENTVSNTNRASNMLDSKPIKYNLNDKIIAVGEVKYKRVSFSNKVHRQILNIMLDCIVEVVQENINNKFLNDELV